jgi:ABC-type histidine transport system ATPase subunit
MNRTAYVELKKGDKVRIKINVTGRKDGQIIESGTPEHFFNNPESERVKQFLGKIIR